MKYREFGKTGLKVSALGFGTMRLPLLEDGVTVDEKEAVRIIRHAIDSGVNYVDTAYPYHQGTSEIVVGKALGDGYRDKVFLADKSPIWKLEKESDFDSILEEQLQKLQTDHIDFYLLHALNKERFEKIKNFHLIDHMLEARKAGKIRYLGFSFHDDLEMFKQIVDYTDQWDFCQIQYNYAGERYQAGTAGLMAAAERGLAVFVMEPLLGGRLAGKLPPRARAVLDDVRDPYLKTPAAWGLSWVWNYPQVTMLLSGMTDTAQVDENAALADRALPDSMTTEQLDTIARVLGEFEKSNRVPCTGCGYCMPCPKGINIPGCFGAYNASYAHSWFTGLSQYFTASAVRTNAPKLVSNCVKCGKCARHCPQHIDIPERLDDVRRRFQPGPVTAALKAFCKTRS